MTTDEACPVCGSARQFQSDGKYPKPSITESNGTTWHRHDAIAWFGARTDGTSLIVTADGAWSVWQGERRRKRGEAATAKHAQAKATTWAIALVVKEAAR